MLANQIRAVMRRFDLLEAETATLARVSLSTLRLVLHKNYTPKQRRTVDDLAAFLAIAKRAKSRRELYAARAA